MSTRWNLKNYSPRFLVLRDNHFCVGLRKFCEVCGACHQAHDPSNNYFVHVMKKVKYIPKGSTSKGTREAATSTTSEVHHGSLWGLNCLKGDVFEEVRCVCGRITRWG